MIWPAQEFVMVNGCRIHYLASGQGPAVLLVHGLIAHSFSWRHNIQALARHFRVYALDLPGLGHSDPPPEHYDCSFGATARLIGDFARAVGERRVLLVGHSFGAAAALVCAASFPDLVAGSVLVAPPNHFSRKRLLIALGGRPAIGTRILRFGWRHARRLAPLLLNHRLYGDAVRADSQTVEGYLEGLKSAACAPTVQRMVAAWNLTSLAHATHANRQPVLVVWGDCDRIVAPASGRSLAEALGARLELFAGCGHMVPEEAPEQFNSVVYSFLGSSPKSVRHW